MKSLKPLGSRIISVEEAMRRVNQMPDVPQKKPQKIPRKDRDYITIGEIVCTDYMGDEFEFHSPLEIEEDWKGTGPIFSAYQDEKRFLPSLALTCNILKQLYQGRNDPFQEQYNQYKNLSLRFLFGDIACNTAVFWEDTHARVVHYPNKGYLPQYSTLNKFVDPAELSCPISPIFKSGPLEEGLKHLRFSRFISNLTGMENPQILLDIANEMNISANIELPSGRGITTGAILKIDSCNLTISTAGDIDRHGTYRLVK